MLRPWESTRFGQVSLFEDSGEKEFADFVFHQVEEQPQLSCLPWKRSASGAMSLGIPWMSTRN